MTSKPRQSNYPIGRYFITLWKESGLSIATFMTALGYRNTSKAIKRFDEWLRWGVGEAHILNSIEQWKPEIKDELDKQLKLTSQIIDIEAAEAKKVLIAEARAAFNPYIEAIPENREPSSICFFALTGGSRRQQMTLPADIHQLDDQLRTETIAALIKEHMAKSRGTTLFQGRIVAYQAFLTFDSRPVTFTTEGVMIGVDIDKTSGQATLMIGNRKFPGVIK